MRTLAFIQRLHLDQSWKDPVSTILQRIVSKAPQNKPGDQFEIVQVLTGFSQWVGSDKLRRDVEWKDRRQLFTEGLKVYRVVHEAVKSGHSNVSRVKGYKLSAPQSELDPLQGCILVIGMSRLDVGGKDDVLRG